MFANVVVLGITASTTNLYSIFIDLKLKDGLNEHCDSKAILCRLFYKSSSDIVPTIFITLWLLVAYAVELIWVMFLMITASWGFYFKSLLSDCINIIERHQVELSEVRIHI